MNQPILDDLFMRVTRLGGALHHLHESLPRNSEATNLRAMLELLATEAESITGDIERLDRDLRSQREVRQ